MSAGTAGSTQRLRLQRRRTGMPQLRYPQLDLDDRFTSTPDVPQCADIVEKVSEISF